MKPTVRTAAAVILLCAITRNLGYLKSEVTELISISLFVLLLYLCLPFGRGSSGAQRAISALTLAALTFLFWAGGQIPRFALIAAALLAGAADRTGRGRNRGENYSLALVVFLFGLYILGVQHSTLFWHMTDRLAKSYSHFAAGLLSRDLLLSATASGLHICVLFVLLNLSIILAARRRTVAGIAAAVVAPAALMGCFAVAGIPWKGGFGVGDTMYVFSHMDLHAVLVLAGLILTWLLAPGGPPAAVPVVPGARAAAMSLLASVLLFVGIFVLIKPTPAESRGKRVLVYDRAQIVWMYPFFGRYGDKSGGMFGYLPRYLEFRGFEARRDTISASSLDGVDLVIAINLAVPFTEEEHRLTWDFVEKGGALLALGDHTGLGSIREPFNSLLEPVGIEFEFDSAKGFTESWVDGMEWRPHESTRPIVDENSTQIWTGASLKLPPNASPTVLGRFAWSDSGDAGNTERAYLGDFSYRQGELLGDVVLAAHARHGKGRVLVFGDTSTFQNGALVMADEFAHACLQWLCKREREGALRGARMPAGIALSAAALVLFVLAGRSSLGAFVMTLALLASPLVASFSGLPPSRSGAADEKIAYIEKAHGERFDLNAWNEDSIGGFTYNLMRNGYFPFLQREFSTDRLDESDLLFVSGACRDFSAEEIEAIDRFVRAGSILLVSAGRAQYKMAPALMEHFGFSVENVPLGPVETVGLGRPVRFYDAYPLACTEQDTTVLCEGYGYPVAVIRKVGAGRVVAMGDTRFFQNKNIEHRDEYIEENIYFLKGLFEKLDREVLVR
jgi:hypothetical protein